MAQSQLPPFAQATAGALGSIASNTLVYPLDLLSTRCQTQSRGKDGKGGYTSILAALQQIVEKNGVGGLYQGIGSDNLSNTLSNFLFFYFRSFFIERVKARKGQGSKAVLSAAEDLAVGAMAGIASRFFTTPLSNVTVRKQTSATPAKKKPVEEERKVGSDSDSDDESAYSDSPGIAEMLQQIVKEKGVLGLWSGFETAALLSISPALTFYSSNAFVKLLVPAEKRQKPAAWQVFVTSALGNSVATMIVFPLILCKTRLQWRSPSGRRMYRSLAEVLRKTLRKGGFKGLYQGLDSQLVKGLFSFGTTMMVKQRIETLFVLLYLSLRSRQKLLS